MIIGLEHLETRKEIPNTVVRVTVVNVFHCFTRQQLRPMKHSSASRGKSPQFAFKRKTTREPVFHRRKTTRVPVFHIDTDSLKLAVHLVKKGGFRANLLGLALLGDGCTKSGHRNNLCQLEGVP